MKLAWAKVFWGGNDETSVGLNGKFAQGSGERSVKERLIFDGQFEVST